MWHCALFVNPVSEISTHLITPHGVDITQVYKHASSQGFRNENSTKQNQTVGDDLHNQLLGLSSKLSGKKLGTNNRMLSWAISSRDDKSCIWLHMMENARQFTFADAMVIFVRCWSSERSLALRRNGHCSHSES